MTSIDKNVKDAIAKHAKADIDAKAAWAELVNAMMPYTDAFIQPHGNGFVQIALPDLDDSRKAFIDAVRKHCATFYGWKKDAVANNFRQWRYRMSKALAAAHGGEIVRKGGNASGKGGNASGKGKGNKDKPAIPEGAVVLNAEQATALNECLLNIQASRKLADAKKLAETALNILERAAS